MNYLENWYAKANSNENFWIKQEMFDAIMNTIPEYGPSPTEAGEILRAVSIIHYELINGFGNELTPVLKFLRDKKIIKNPEYQYWLKWSDGEIMNRKQMPNLRKLWNETMDYIYENYELLSIRNDSDCWEEKI